VRSATSNRVIEKYKLTDLATYLLTSNDLKMPLCFAIGDVFSKFPFNQHPAKSLAIRQPYRELLIPALLLCLLMLDVYANTLYSNYTPPRY
jgi:hypothetical protein